MKALTVDYEPHHVYRVTIEVPDDVDMDNLNPYDWHKEIAYAASRGDRQDLGASDDGKLTVVSLDPVPPTKTVHLVYTATRGIKFDADVPAELEGEELKKYVQDAWDTLVEPNIINADLDTFDTSLEFANPPQGKETRS